MKSREKIILSFILMLITFISCDDTYLDREDDGKLQEKEVFTRFRSVEKLVTQLYSDMYTRSPGLNTIYSHNIGTICDELEFNKADSDGPYKILNGELSADPTSIDEVGGGGFGWWWMQYQAIRKANKILWGVDEYKTPDHPSEPGLLKQRMAETRFFRVYYHYCVLRLHGEMCYIDEAYSPAVDPASYAYRESVHRSIDKMCIDLDLAAADLPESWGGKDFNRIDKGVCLSLKAILRYIAAQPLYNGGIDGVSALGPKDTRVGAAEYTIYDADRWLYARDAAAAVVGVGGLKGSRYSLYDKYSESDFVDDLGDGMSKSGNKVYTRLTKMFSDNDFYHKEAILTLRGGKDTRWMQDNLPDDPTYIGQTRNQPTQNHVDCYEYIVGDAGYSIFSTEAKVGGYDDGDPYVNRDPRFYRDVIYAGSIYQEMTYNTSVGGNNELINSTARETKQTRTGYALRKFIAEDFDKESVGGLMSFPLIRLPEIMLIYAESLNESGGSAQEIVDILNEIRDRSFMKPVPAKLLGDKELRGEYIARERRVELFFENNRYFDLRYKAIPTSVTELTQESKYLSISSSPDERAQKWITDGYGEYPQTQHYIHGMRAVADPNGKIKLDGKIYRMERFEGLQLVRKFTFRNYFFPINSNEIAKTPSLVQNPGW